MNLSLPVTPAACRLQPTEAQIRLRAYQISLERGQAPGHEADDWLQAEYELMQLPLRQIIVRELEQARPPAAAGTLLVDLIRAAVALGTGALSLWNRQCRETHHKLRSAP